MQLLVATLTLILPLISSGSLPNLAENSAEHPARPITTTIHYANGDEQRNQGIGFVVGSRFFTAYHNIQSGSAEVTVRQIMIGGTAVEPAAVDIAHDLAVFEIPNELCPIWCNDLEFGSQTPESTTAVVWARLEGEQRIWKQGRVNNLAFKAAVIDNTSAGCEHNLIVEIDQPFIPGSSGGPVFDAASGVIVGLIQGSFETQFGEVTGYYKPSQCVMSRVEKMGLALH